MSDKPGIYYDVPDAEYRGWLYPSQSLLSLWRDSDLCEEEIKDHIDNPPESTDAMELGELVEAAVDGVPLRPEVQQLPDEIRQRRGVAWETLRDANPGVTYLPRSEYAKVGEQIDMAKAMAAKIRATPLAAKLLHGATRQISFVWDCPVDGREGKYLVRVKGRLDYLNLAIKPNCIPDLKTTAMGGQRSVGRQAYLHGWDIQAALYTDAMTALLGKELSFYFLVCRTVRPHVVTIYNGHNTREAAGAMLSMGRFAYQRYLDDYTRCLNMGKWRGYFSEDCPDSHVLDFELPSWAF